MTKPTKWLCTQRRLRSSHFVGFVMLWFTMEWLSFQGETYSFKEAIVLAEYKVDTASAARDGLKRPDKVRITHICLIDFPSLIIWTSPFPDLGVTGVLFKKAQWWAYRLGKLLSSVIRCPHSLNIFSS